MSVYHNSFSYLGKNSSTDMGWVITHFDDGADVGETDTFLSTSAIYSESYDGTRRQLHGVKYDTVVEAHITVVKQDGTCFGVQDNRDALRWLTGSRQATWMDLYISDEVKYRLLGRVSNVSQYKLDARVIGLIITFESVSPYGYSSLQSGTVDVEERADIDINCDSDDLYAYIPMNVQFTNLAPDGQLEISNSRMRSEKSVISGGLAVNETITLSDNMMITSDNTVKTFGNTFNYKFPKLAAGTNHITVKGIGTFSYEYIAPVKLGNIAIDVNSASDPICDSLGTITSEYLDWSRITNTPTTLSGYGVTDVYTKIEVNALVSGINLNDFYTKQEIDILLQNIDVDNVYTKPEIDEMLSNFVSDDVYTKSEIDAKFEQITVSDIDIDEVALNAMLAEVLGE